MLLSKFTLGRRLALSLLVIVFGSLGNFDILQRMIISMISIIRPKPKSVCVSLSLKVQVASCFSAQQQTLGDCRRFITGQFLVATAKIQLGR